MLYILRKEHAHYLAWLVSAKYVPVSTVVEIEKSSRKLITRLLNVMKNVIVEILPEQAALCDQALQAALNIIPNLANAKQVNKLINEVNTILPETLIGLSSFLFRISRCFGSMPNFGYI